MAMEGAVGEERAKKIKDKVKGTVKEYQKKLADNEYVKKARDKLDEFTGDDDSSSDEENCCSKNCCTHECCQKYQWMLHHVKTSPLYQELEKTEHSACKMNCKMK